MKQIKAKIAQKRNSQIKIDTDFIRLDSALKLANLVQSGGHAKAVIQDGEVIVNGEVCEMRGKKLHIGDRFEYGLNVVEVTGA